MKSFQKAKFAFVNVPAILKYYFYAMPFQDIGYHISSNIHVYLYDILAKIVDMFIVVSIRL